MALGFKGGIFVEHLLPKDLSVTELALCDRLVYQIPEGFFVTVKEGDAVSKGAILAEHSDGSVFLSTVGGVVSVVSHQILELIPIDAPIEERPLCEDLGALTSAEIVEYIRKYGIFSESGIPIWRMLSPAIGCGELLILGAVETEPGICCVRAMLDAYPEKVAGGLKILMKALSLGKAVIAICESMQSRAKTLKRHFHSKDMAQIALVTPKYPIEEPIVLYKCLTGSVAPPSARKAVIVSVSDCIAVYDLFASGGTVSRQVVTVCEKNYSAYIGTPLSAIASLCGIVPAEGTTVHVGGYIGARAAKEDEAITASTKGVQYLIPAQPMDGNCIECGRCYDHCPVYLLPQKLVAAIQSKNEKFLQSGVLDACIDCGICSAVCPIGLAPHDIIRAYRSVSSTKQTEEGSGECK